ERLPTPEFRRLPQRHGERLLHDVTRGFTAADDRCERIAESDVPVPVELLERLHHPERAPAAPVSLARPAVRDRRTAVAPECLRAQLDARWGLAALVLGAVDHRERPLDDVDVEAVLRELFARAVELDVGLQHLVQL